MSDVTLCPCGSDLGYDACCGPIHGGAPAKTAKALMRSRFSAFALGLPAYLLMSWHPSTRPASLEPEPDTEWRRLQLVDVVAGGPDDSEGVVEFRASYRHRVSGAAGVLHERSRFIRFDGRWVYVDGDQFA